MTQQEILQDALIATKFLSSMYNNFGLECSNQQLRNLVTDNNAIVYDHNLKIFDIMAKEGFYPVTKAESKEVNEAVKMHTQMQQDLDKKLEQN